MLLGLLALGVGLPGMQSSTAAAAGVVNAPEFRVVTLAGEPYTRATLEGHPTLLVFWAPWCKVCQRELPILGQFYRQEKPERLRVLSIGFADSRATVEQFVKGRPGTFVFPTAYDEENRMAQSYRINATPTFILVSEHGQIVLIHRGGGLLQNVQFREFLSTLKA
jgi:thiol-disulfide isomerase/thioredoxin